MRYGLDEYARMLVDPVRGAAYLAAVRETVRPGMVVADIGAGPGALGVYAATLGARRVFLVDPDLSVIAGRALAEENGVGDRVDIFRSISTETELPEAADVIISDLRGVTPFDGNHLQAALDMRTRLLAPAGVCIPRRDVAWMALVEDHSLHARTAGAWSSLPIELSHASLDVLVSNRWYRARARGDQMISDAAEFVTLDYDEPIPALSRQCAVTATRDGTAHGLLLWFDTLLTNSVRFSNAPSAPPALYGQAFFPFATPIEVVREDCLTVALRAVPSGGDFAWDWTVTDRHGRSQRHASLRALPLDPACLARRSERFVPRRSPSADHLMALLEEADTTSSLGELATRMHRRFGERFLTVQAALDYASQFDDLWLPEVKER